MLRDHFRPPLSDTHPWETFHSGWANAVAAGLNDRTLPRRCYALPHIRLGTQVEVDVVTLRDDEEPGPPAASPNGAVATAVEVYGPPAPPVSAGVGFAEPDLFEVRVMLRHGGPRVVAAIELVSPSNKDRPDTRRTFATKCASYLQTGVSVVVVDVVTERRADMHADLADVLRLPAEAATASPGGLAAMVYRTTRTAAAPGHRLDIWPFPLAVGGPLPVVPLWLAADFAVPLDLGGSYAAACRALRVGGS